MAKDKKNKVHRPKAITPKGFRDYFGAEVNERAEMLRAITDVYHRYGFDPLETSAVETAAMRWGRSGATKSPDRAGIVNSINAMPIRSGPDRWRRMPRFVRCCPTRWRP